VRAFAESVRARHGVQFDIRIGFNSGEVMIGRISDERPWRVLFSHYRVMRGVMAVPPPIMSGVEPGPDRTIPQPPGHCPRIRWRTSVLY